MSSEVLSAAVENAQASLSLLATLLAPGTSPRVIDVGEEGMGRDEFLRASGVNISAAESKGTSFRNQYGDPLGNEDRVRPGDRVSAVSNRDNG